MKVLVEVPNDDNKTLYSMKVGTVVEDQQDFIVSVLLDGATFAQQFHRHEVHIPWRELQRWISSGTAQEDAAVIYLRRGIAFTKKKFYHEAMQCFKLAMEERCALGIILKNDSVWCEGYRISMQFWARRYLLFALSLHHEKCTRTPDADHYTYIKKKRTVKVFTNDSNKRRRGILRNIPEWEINKQERLGVVLHGDADGLYQVQPVIEMTYTRDQLIESTRAENGVGGFTYARDMKLRELNGKFFIVWDELDEQKQTWRSHAEDDFSFWDEAIKVLELKDVSSKAIHYKKLHYEHGSTTRFRKIGVRSGTCVILPADSSAPNSEEPSTLRQVYLVTRKFYTEADFAEATSIQCLNIHQICRCISEKGKIIRVARRKMWILLAVHVCHLKSFNGEMMVHVKWKNARNCYS